MPMFSAVVLGAATVAARMAVVIRGNLLVRTPRVVGRILLALVKRGLRA